MKPFFKLQLLLLVLCCAPWCAIAQTYQVQGRITDAADTTPLIGVSISLYTPANKWLAGTATDNAGRFLLTNVAPGKYDLMTSYTGYNHITLTINVINGNVALGDIKMKGDNQLNNVTIKDKQSRGEQTGDTSQFNADAFKVHPDATAEDLVKKMPGVTSDNDGVKVNGETVKQVLVDGRPFFGTDPSASLKNLPAEIIDKIQVYDKQSDQAAFTGFNDANAQKTINVVTKNGKNQGQFGKAYAGYGTDGRYSTNLTLNSFNGAQRISLLALSNNINQQNFSFEDIMGVMSNSSSSGGGGGSGGPGGGGRSNAGGNGGGGGAGGTFFAGQQSGNTTTHSAGLNYTDDWGKKIKVSGSYFFNYTNNTNQSDISRQYLTDTSIRYKQNSLSKAENYNNRVNFRLEYKIDSSNSLIITPRLSYQKYVSSTDLAGTTFRAADTTATTDNRSASDKTAYTFNNDILFQHRFGKPRRTISVNINTQLSGQTGGGSYYSLSQYKTDTSSTLQDQQYDLINHTNAVSGNLAYTEPMGRNGQLMVNYTSSYSRGNADKETNAPNAIDGTYTDLDTALSNKIKNTYTTQNGGVSYRLSTQKMNLMVGAAAQYAQLKADETFPYDVNINKTFTSVLPNASLNYRFDRTTNLNISYRSATNAPSISQLQNVVDISNPLLVKAGNADLKQNFDNSFTARFGRTNPGTSRNFFTVLSGTFTQNYITNATYIPTKDTVFEGYTIASGGQLSRPVNLDGYVNGRMFAVYSLPVALIKSNVNFNGGVNYSHTPALVNNVVNYSNSYTANGGFYLGSNISSNLDFSLSYNGNYNVTKNTLQSSSNNSYYSQTTMFKINWILFNGLVINTDVTHTLYTGLTQSYNQNFFLWNAYLGYKMLKSKALEAKVSMFDILNQNRSITRNITDTYIEDTKTNVLKRYAMLTLTYTIRNFKHGTAPEQIKLPNGMPPPGNMPGGGMRFGPPMGG